MSPVVKYVGPHRPGVDVTIDHLTGESVAVEYLHEQEVTGTVRDNLLAQSKDYEAAHGSALWSEVKPSNASKSTTKES